MLNAPKKKRMSDTKFFKISPNLNLKTMSDNKLKFYTKLTLEVNMPNVGLTQSSITRDAWDLSINEIQVLLEGLLLSSGYQPNSVSSIFNNEEGKNDE